jgi:Flp pilus assembly CpaF family ATPase
MENKPTEKGTASGKTNTLNIISNFDPNDKRIITIEDSKKH